MPKEPGILPIICELKNLNGNTIHVKSQIQQRRILKSEWDDVSVYYMQVSLRIIRSVTLLA